MNSVETLDIAYPEKGQLDSLKSFPNLKVLYFQGGELSDITTLQGSKKLTRLTVADCKVRDFEGIEYFENLQEIILYNLNIDDPSKLLALKELKNIPTAKLIGIPTIKYRTAVVSLDFTPSHLDNGLISHYLSKDYGIMTRCGLHCAPSAHKTLGTFPNGTVRFSFSHSNSKEDVLYTIDAINKCIKDFP